METCQINNRISKNLEPHQSEDQFGFRSKRSASHALLVLESLVLKGVEFDAPVWILSLDLRKAFDRIEHGPLFEALRQH